MTKPLISGILFLIAVKLDFVAKLLISGLFSAVLILFSNSFILLLKSAVFNFPLISGIFNSILPILLS